jgi:hypothetical protein
MLSRRIPELIETKPPASSAELGHLQECLGLELPLQYKGLLSESDGISANLVQIYACSEVPERNTTYAVQESVPGFFVFGTVNCFPLLLRAGAESPVYEADWGWMAKEDLRVLGASLEDWISRGCPDGSSVVV